MKNLIETLKSSKNVFLNAEGASIEKWKSLPHNKEGLELFLKFNIAEILYGDKKIFCTSNKELVNRILEILEIKQTLTENAFTSIRNIVISWDLNNDKIISFSMKNKWSILNFIQLSPQNINLITSVIKEILQNARKNIPKNE